jgi:hypothetical protein
MTVIVTKPTKVALFDDGEYDAVITGVEEQNDVQTTYEVKNMVVLVFDAGGTEVRKRYSRSLHERSDLYALVKELVGEPGDSFDLDTLIGTLCRVFITHVETETGVWRYVNNVRKTEATQAEAALPTVEEDANAAETRGWDVHLANLRILRAGSKPQSESKRE